MDAVHWFDHNRAMTVPTIGLAPFDEALRLIAIGEMLMVALVVGMGWGGHVGYGVDVGRWW